MDNSIIIYDSFTKLINPNDEEFKSKKIIELFWDNEKNIDEMLSDFIGENLTKSSYNNILLPLCFGKTLSDYLGLRLACHIRCTPSINQQANIYIYSFTGIVDLFSNDCFNILKTKGIFLIDYDIDAILKCYHLENRCLSKENLNNEIKKLNLQMPANLDDNHSVANLWAMDRWSQAVGIDDEKIKSLIDAQTNDLYFKYLKTIYPNSSIAQVDSKNLKINYKGQPKILYIDDEAEKGWLKIFEKILKIENGINFKHLDEEFNEKSRDEIIEISINKLINEDIGLVILDFRLHKDDFDEQDLKQITGFKILKRIKKHNKGIQVVIFSATNKVWNLQALLEAGADGFIVKESPEYFTDKDYSFDTIKNICDKITECLEMKFLISSFKYLDSIKKHIDQISNISREEGLMKLMKLKFKNEMNVQAKIIFECLKNARQSNGLDFENKQAYLNLAFISIYKIIELINDFYTDERGTKIKFRNIPILRFEKKTNSFIKINQVFPSVLDKICTIMSYELNMDISKYYDKLFLFNSHRKNIIHPENLKKYYKASENDNVNFLKLIYEMIERMK